MDPFRRRQRVHQRGCAEWLVPRRHTQRRRTGHHHDSLTTVCTANRPGVLLLERRHNLAQRDGRDGRIRVPTELRAKSTSSGPINIVESRTTNGGTSWTRTVVDGVFTGSTYQNSSVTTCASDASGNLLLLYSGATALGANDHVWGTNPLTPWVGDWSRSEDVFCP